MYESCSAETYSYDACPSDTKKTLIFLHFEEKKISFK